MNNIFIFFLMIFLHCFADYNLQGWLASAKQKDFWKKNAPEKMYQKDYICALITHSFVWAFCVMLPIFFKNNFNIDFSIMLFLILTTIVHALIDNLKANKYKISLCQDQLLHLTQIAILCMFFF